ncbi:MAG: PIG-L family deacetylase [Nitrospirae bacterium]|nr:PIG-L family deacetylase [Nitrospirota bacterium]MBI3351916.1 PIG-L family deacetylase [Nitrospirota bacterium]
MKIWNKIKNWRQPRLYWKNIFKYYADQFSFQKSSVKIIKPGQEKSVLVLCPHIDDDVIGLGGTLYQYRQLGVPVTVIYFTTENERRKKEGESIRDFLGYKETKFYDFQPEQLSHYPDISALLESFLKKNSFDVIYTPFHLDRHKDHIALALHLAKALERIPELNAEIRCYEVWSPLFPNQIVDISDVVEFKRKGILICQSQMESVNYVDLALSLNRYRGITSTREKQMAYAEAFYSCTPYAYLKLLKIENPEK